jgi:hypothetical protein
MMISDGVTKSTDRSIEKPHSFPLLDKSAGNGGASASNHRNQSFKPLFDNTSLQPTITPHKGFGASGPKDMQNAVDRVRQQGFGRGFDAGSQDACSMVREELAPQIKAVADAFNQWNAIMVRFEENSSLQILKMADSIARKILGDPPKCSAAGLDSLMVELRDHMREAYRIEFMLNPEDRDVLVTMMACEHPQWGKWDYISVNSDREFQRGSLRVQTGKQTILTDDGIIRTLEVLLSQVSTK